MFSLLSWNLCPLGLAFGYPCCCLGPCKVRISREGATAIQLGKVDSIHILVSGRGERNCARSCDRKPERREGQDGSGKPTRTKPRNQTGLSENWRFACKCALAQTKVEANVRARGEKDEMTKHKERPGMKVKTGKLWKGNEGEPSVRNKGQTSSKNLGHLASLGLFYAPRAN